MVDSLQLSNPLDLLHNKKRQRDEIDQNPIQNLFPQPRQIKIENFHHKETSQHLLETATYR